MPVRPSRQRTLCSLGLAAVLSGIALELPVLAFDAVTHETLTGNVQHDVYTYTQAPHYQGTVMDATSGLPIPHAQVHVPQAGLQTMADAQGRFTLPALARDPMIVNVTKAGYAPESRTLQAHASFSEPFKIYLRDARRVLILDNQIRHLGDNSYSPHSAGVGQFRRRSEGVALAYRFSLNTEDLSRDPILQIGSIIGLDTRMAQALRQNNIPYASSPMIIRLNGEEIAALHINGDGQRVPLPAHKLRPRGENVLVIETGYHTPGGTRIDYDDFEYMNLQLEL